MLYKLSFGCNFVHIIIKPNSYEKINEKHFSNSSTIYYFTSKC